MTALMSLKETIQKDMIAAMRAKDAEKLSVIRMLISAIKYKEVEGTAKELDDEGVLSVIQGEVKKRRDSAGEYEKAGRTDLADKEKAEMNVLLSYLPAQLSDANLETMVVAAIAEAGATSAKDLGAVMKIVTPKTKGRADGKRVSEMVKAKLS